jgi:hypothetical protein
MTAGVGSISGRVTENGEPLGGVRLTASNGDTTTETTSLTEGDRGAFTFPRLAIPGRYTITASLDGYSTQTRVVVLDGNTSGVNFDFTKTTGAITGIVASSSGVDLPGANIRVSRDELAFDTKSAVSPDPGSFTITDLPPGTYLVEFARFDHAPYSQSVTIAAGQVVDLGRVVLEFRGRPDIAQNGGVEVRVVNSLGDPLNGTTVRVIDISTERVVAEQSDAPTAAAPDGTRSTFVFQPLRIGTYRIEVSKGETYRVSTRRTSVGLEVRPETIPLYRLGQASGRVIDSFSKVELIDYDVQIFRINPDGSETFVQGIPVTADTPPTNTPDGPEVRWETAAASLTSGTYRVNVVNPPPGYRVVPDQVLVPGLPPMQFVISPTNDTPLDLGDILADRYPEVRGTILAPQLAAAPATAVTFGPITAGGLTVELSCPGTDGTEQRVLLDALRPTVPPGSPIPDPGLEDVGNGPALDSYFFDRITLESNDLSGECTLTVNADGYQPSVTPVLVSPGDGSSDPLVYRNIAMIRPDAVGGRTYWLDKGVTPSAEVAAPGVAVRTQGNVVVGFDPGVTERTLPGSDASPVLSSAALSQTGDGAGLWAFVDPRQVFGATNYVFSKPGQFSDRVITIRLDQGGRLVTAADSATLRLDSSGSLIQVELDAVGGLITTQVNVATIKGTAASPGNVDLSGFTVALTGATAASAVPTISGANAGGLQPARATFPTVDPGTVQVAVTSTATSGGRPLFVPSGGQPPSFRQDPGTNVTVPPVTFIEQGAINVAVNDVGNRPIPGTTVNIVNASTGTNYPVALTGSPATVVQAGLPVSPTVGALTPYTISLASDPTLDLDESTAQLSVFNENGALVRQCQLATPGCGSITVAQGGQPRVVIRVSRLGSLRGTVLGDDGNPAFVPLVPPALAVVAQRVATENCALLATPDPARPVRAVGNDFQFSGPPGLYRLQFSHPDYEGTPVDGPPQEPEDICTIPNPDPFGPPTIQNPALRGFVYRLQNDDQRVLDEPFFTLRVLPSAVTVEVTNDSLDLGPGQVGAPVGGATVTMTRQSSGAVATGQTDTTTGRAAFNLVPGAYTVAVTRIADGVTTYFPVLFTMSLPAGGRPVVVEVPLPRVGGDITGDVVAWNSEDNPVAVPAGVQVTDSYDVPDPRITGPAGATVGTVQNPGPRAPVDAVPGAAPPETPSTYEIENVASGVHTLSFNDVGGDAYAPPAPIPVTVLGLVSQPAPDAVYRAADRTVVVTVGVTEASARPDGSFVRLVDPDAPAGGAAIAVDGCTGTAAARTCTATFTAVPPEVATYDVEVTKVRYGTALANPFTVAPGDPAVPIAVRVNVAGSVATVNGVAEAQNAPSGAQVPLPTAGLVELFRVGQTAPIATTPPAANGTYTFDITARGSYQIRASAPGYAPRTLSFVIDRTGGVGDLGSEITLGTVSVPRLATFAITVTPPEARTASTVDVAVTGTPTIAPASTATATGFDVVVDPGASYRFTITSPNGFVPLTVPGAAQQPDVGGNVPLAAAMVERTITGTVSGTDGTVSVRATRAPAGSGTIAGTVAGSTYTITRVPDGVWTVEAARYPGGRGTSASVGVLSGSASFPNTDVTLVPRQVTISFTGTVPANVAIALTGGLSGVATGGTLSLNHPETGFPVTWTATADGYVPGGGSIAQPPAPADPFAPSLSVTGPPVTLVRPDVTATVAPATGADPVTDAAVYLCAGATGECAATTAGAIPMPFGAGVYRATPPASGAWRIGASRGVDVAVPVSLTVSTDGTVTPPAVALTLVAPPPPPTTTTTVAAGG